MKSANFSFVLFYSNIFIIEIEHGHEAPLKPSYIYFACLFVCPCVSNKRQIDLTDRVQIWFGTSHGPREGLQMIKISKIIFQQNSFRKSAILVLYIIYLVAIRIYAFTLLTSI